MLEMPENVTWTLERLEVQENVGFQVGHLQPFHLNSILESGKDNLCGS